METINIIHSYEDVDFVNKLSRELSERGYEIAKVDSEWGLEIDRKIQGRLRQFDIHMAIISRSSLESKIFYDQIIQARNYSTHSSNKLFLPVFLGNIEFDMLPKSLASINGPRVKRKTDKEIFDLATTIDESINLFTGRKLAKEENEEKVKKQIESSAPNYIQETLGKLTEKEDQLKKFATIWYNLGYITLISGVGFSLWLTFSGSTQINSNSDWGGAVFLGIKSALIIVLLLAASKYAFNLGKSYMSESLKVADRIHAISFGKFYLQVFNEEIEQNDIKDIFRDWNITGDSAFSEQDVNEHDPNILQKLIELVDKIKSN